MTFLYETNHDISLVRTDDNEDGFYEYNEIKLGEVVTYRPSAFNFVRGNKKFPDGTTAYLVTVITDLICKDGMVENDLVHDIWLCETEESANRLKLFLDGTAPQKLYYGLTYNQDDVCLDWKYVAWLAGSDIFLKRVVITPVRVSNAVEARWL